MKVEIWSYPNLSRKITISVWGRNPPEESHVFWRPTAPIEGETSQTTRKNNKNKTYFLEDQKLRLRAKPSKKICFKTTQIICWRPKAPIEGETLQKKTSRQQNQFSNTTEGEPLQKIHISCSACMFKTCMLKKICMFSEGVRPQSCSKTNFVVCFCFLQGFALNRSFWSSKCDFVVF